ncbi:MAG: hypothetical protein PHV34_19210 [Verrucomicrobiae bacterium]|nr:hypothetical protein [Verrucomicrobiae bacterium]
MNWQSNTKPCRRKIKRPVVMLIRANRSEMSFFLHGFFLMPPASRVGEGTRAELRPQRRSRAAESGSWMKPLINPAKIRKVNMRVNLRCFDAGMSKHFLNHAKVGAALQKMSCKRMSEHVRGDAFFQPRRLPPFVDNEIDFVRTQRLAPAAKEKDAGIASTSRQAGPGLEDIPFEPFAGDMAKRNDAFFVALANHPDQPFMPQYSAQLNAGDFRPAQAGSVKQFQDCTIADIQKRNNRPAVKQLIDFGMGEMAGEESGKDWIFQAGEKIRVLDAGKAKKSPDGRYCGANAFRLDSRFKGGFAPLQEMGCRNVGTKENTLAMKERNEFFQGQAVMRNGMRRQTPFKLKVGKELGKDIRQGVRLHTVDLLRFQNGR